MIRVRTSKLRLEIDSDGTNSTGILEWKVYDSGDSPKFPPSVVGDVDRVVMLGGKTYLRGAIKSLGGEGDASTTGDVEQGIRPRRRGLCRLRTPSKPRRRFDKVGDYVLKLTAEDGELNSAATLKVHVELPPPPTPLDVVYTKRYKIDSPLWNHRAKALITNWIPYCIDQINTPNLPEGKGGIDNFVEAAKKLAGQPAGPHRGYVFSNAWVHQTVESMCIALMVDPQGDGDIARAQEKLKATLEDWIPKILAAQEPDGYLQTAITLDDSKHRWSPQGPRRPRRLYGRLFHRIGDQPLHAHQRHRPAALQRGQEAGRLLGRQHRPGAEEGLVRRPSGNGTGAGALRPLRERHGRQRPRRQLHPARQVPA